MSLTAGMETALEAGNVTLAGLLKIEFPGYTLRLADGGVVKVGAETYPARDERFGTIGSISEFSDGDTTQAPHMTISFLPPTNSAAADLSSPLMQGSILTLSLAVISRATGLVIPDPYVLFVGEVDVPTLTVDKGTREVSFDIAYAFERCFEQDEGARLTDGFHQSIHLGQLGFGFVTADPTTLPWGVAGARPTIVTGAAPVTGVTDLSTRFYANLNGFQ